MRLIASFFVFCAVSFSQSATDNYLKNRLKALKLEPPAAMRGQTVVITGMPERNSVCAIPLLNALPAQSRIDYKLRKFKPASAPELASAAKPIGLPACK